MIMRTYIDQQQRGWKELPGERSQWRTMSHQSIIPSENGLWEDLEISVGGRDERDEADSQTMSDHPRKCRSSRFFSSAVG